jgi:acyl carrier protein
METQTFLHEIEEVVDVDSGSLSGEETLDEIPNWDSLAFLSFLAMADSRFGLKIDPETLRTAKSVSDLCAILAPGMDATSKAELDHPVVQS